MSSAIDGLACHDLVHPLSHRRRRNSADEVESSSRWWWHMGGEVRSPVRGASPEVLSRPMSPVDLGRGMFSSYILGSGLEGLVCASPTARHQRYALR